MSKDKSNKVVSLKPSKRVRHPTNKQQEFARVYVQGNGEGEPVSASEAYRLVYNAEGMSQKSIAKEAHNLLYNPIVTPIIDGLKREKDREIQRITHSRREVILERLEAESILTDPESPTANSSSRIRALELLAKASGALEDTININSNSDKTTAELREELAIRLQEIMKAAG